MSRKKSLSPAEINRIVNMHVDGMKSSSIARAMRRDPRTVVKALSEHSDLIEMASAVKQSLVYDIKYPVAWVEEDRGTGTKPAKYFPLDDEKRALLSGRNYIGHYGGRTSAPYGHRIQSLTVGVEETGKQIIINVPAEKKSDWEQTLELVPLMNIKMAQKARADENRNARKISEILQQDMNNRYNLGMLRIFYDWMHPRPPTIVYNNSVQNRGMSLSDILLTREIVRDQLKDQLFPLNLATMKVMGDTSEILDELKNVDESVNSLKEKIGETRLGAAEFDTLIFQMIMTLYRKVVSVEEKLDHFNHSVNFRNGF